MSQSEPESKTREAALTAALRALAEDDANQPGASPAVEARLLEEVRALAGAANAVGAVRERSVPSLRSPSRAPHSVEPTRQAASGAADAADVGDTDSAAVAVRDAGADAGVDTDSGGAAFAWRRRRALLPVAAWGAIAAALLVGFVVSSWRWRDPVRQPEAIAVTPSVAGSGASQAEVPAPAPVEAATAFLPLIYSNVPITNGQVVRMEVPRTALASFGLASIDVRDGASAGTVLADVLVGEDGLARAVRFVRAAAAVRQKEGP